MQKKFCSNNLSLTKNFRFFLVVLNTLSVERFGESTQIDFIIQLFSHQVDQMQELAGMSCHRLSSRDKA